MLNIKPRGNCIKIVRKIPLPILCLKLRGGDFLLKR